jgi:7,8-dihydro-6-hydroxymethylpterin-pyrophosphokinase
MPGEKRALVSVKAFSNKGLHILRDALVQIRRQFTVSALSSVYRVNRPAESLAGLRDIKKEEVLEGLACVIKIETHMSSMEVLTWLTRIENELQKEVLRKTVSLNLMTYESEIVMLPSLALPHPELHLRPEEVIPAVEVWPDYEHPVLKKTLLELSRRFTNVKWGEFFTQSDALLDFSKTTE